MYCDPSGFASEKLDCTCTSGKGKGDSEEDTNKRSEVQRERWKEYTGKDPTGEVHHGLPEQHKKWFEEHGITDINSGEYYYDLPKDKHRLKSGNGIHTNSSGLTIKTANGTKNVNWNKAWQNFIDNHPKATKEDILAQLAKMEKQTGIGQYKAKKG